MNDEFSFGYPVGVIETHPRHRAILKTLKKGYLILEDNTWFNDSKQSLFTIEMTEWDDVIRLWKDVNGSYEKI